VPRAHLSKDRKKKANSAGAISKTRRGSIRPVRCFEATYPSYSVLGFANACLGQSTCNKQVERKAKRMVFCTCVWPEGGAGVGAVPSVKTPVTVDHVRELLLMLWSCTSEAAEAAGEEVAPVVERAHAAAAAGAAGGAGGAAATAVVLLLKSSTSTVGPSAPNMCNV